MQFLSGWPSRFSLTAASTRSRRLTNVVAIFSLFVFRKPKCGLDLEEPLLDETLLKCFKEDAGQKPDGVCYSRVQLTAKGLAYGFGQKNGHILTGGELHVWALSGQDVSRFAAREAAGSSGTLTVGFFGRIVEDTEVLPTLRIGAADRAVLFSRFTLKCHCVIPVDRTKNEIFSRSICDPLT